MYRGRARFTLMSNPANIDAEVADADLLIVAGADPPRQGADGRNEEDGGRLRAQVV
jgi:hypothetical protein